MLDQQPNQQGKASFMQAELYMLRQLTSIHPDVEALEIDISDDIESWQLVAKAYPSVKAISIEGLKRVAGKSVLDKTFFDAFPALESLEISQYSSCRHISADFTGVDASQLAQLTKLELRLCTSEDMSVLGLLPKLTTLRLTPWKRLKLHAQPGCGLQSLELELLKKDCVLDIDLSHAPLTRFEQEIQRCNDDIDFDISMPNLRLPASLESLKLELSTTSALPEHMLSSQPQLTSLWLEQTGGSLSDKLFEPLRRIKRCRLELKSPNAPLPVMLFNADCQLETLDIKLSGTALSGPMLPANAQVQDLTLSADNKDLSPLQQLSVPGVKRLWLFLDNLEQVPAWLGQCHALTNLNMGVSDASAFPALPALQKLTLQKVKSGPLPATVLNHPGISQLAVINHQLRALGDLSNMQALQEIWLVPSYDPASPRWQQHDLQSMLPSFSGVEHLPALEELRLDVMVDTIDPAWLHMAPSAVLKVKHQHLATELDIIKAANCDSATALYWLSTLLPINKANELPQMPAEFHLTLMTAKYNRFKAQHKQWLRQEALASESRTPLGCDSIVFISGSSEFKAAELKAKAQELGFTLAKNLDAKVTHVLIGRTPKQLDKLDLRQHALIDDTSLQQFFTAQAPKFLQQQDAKAMGENVLAMLKSPDESAHMLAVEMLNQGGVTQEMCLPLFFILKTTSNKALRKQIQHLLAGMGDDVFQLAVTDKIFFDNVRGKDKYDNHYGQGQMVAKLKAQKKKWGEPLCYEFAKAYFARFNEGLMYLLMQKPITDELLSVWQSLIEGDTLNVRRGAGFDTLMRYWDQADPESNYHWHPRFYANNDNKLGAAAFELPTKLPGIDNIQGLDLGNCLLSKLPKGAEAFKHVRVLSLANNTLETLPAALAKFTELEELDLSFNHFDEFPEQLFKLTRLKRLDFRRASRPDLDDNYGPYYQGISVPQAFKDAFPDCEIIEDKDK